MRSASSGVHSPRNTGSARFEPSGLSTGREEGFDLRRMQSCAAPSVHGGKGTRVDVP